MSAGVYEIVNLETGARYIGSAISLQRRWSEHRYRLNKGNHHSPYLQRSWDKHGEKAFAYRVLLVCDQAHRLMYEQLLLDGLKPIYNSVPVAGNCQGRITSEATRNKLSDALRGRVVSEETRERMRIAARGRVLPKWSEERRKRVSDALRGRPAAPRSAEHKAKLAAANRKFSNQQIRQMRDLLAHGLSQASVALKFSCSAALVCNVASGKSHPGV